MISDILLRLAINRLSVLRPHEKIQLEEIVDTEAFFRALTPGLLSQITGRRVRWMDATADDLLRLAERDLRYVQSRRCVVMCVRDRSYPAALREIFDPPYLLYLRGTAPSAMRPAVAVVGTRAPSAPAVIAARELGAGLAAAGLPVISGLARGIDIAAHEGALAGGVTGAILASGIDMVTPSSHRAQAMRILERGGFLASEYAPGTAPRKYHFPARNRIISGLARGVVVVQAPARSGALITADYALDQGRDLFVHRAGLGVDAGAGGDGLAADGAYVIEGADDVLDDWGIPRASRATDRTVSTAHPWQAASGEDAAAHRIAAMRRTIAGEVSP